MRLTLRKGSDHVPLRHDHSTRFLGNHSVALIHVGRVRIERIYNYGPLCGVASKWMLDSSAIVSINPKTLIAIYQRSMPSTVISRRSMYELVWSKPMTKAAQDFGISDVALKKICQKHRVPTPPRGYWAKREAGKPVKQIRFVETADPLDERITIHGSNQADLPAPVREVLQKAREARIARFQVLAPVVTSTVIPIEQIHPAIASTARKLRTHKPDKDGVVSAHGNGTCGIDVGTASLERCITVLDALARSLDAKGIAIAPTGSAVVVSTGGEQVPFRLTEYVRRDKHVPTPDELAAEERRRQRQRITWDSPYGRVYPEWDFIRTGELIIEIENQYARGLRRRWKDGKQQRLENCIDEIVTGILAYAVAVRLRHEERERCNRNYERRRRINARADAREEREGERQKILDELVAISTEASKLRIWLEEAKRWPERSQSDEFTRFVEWARKRLEYLDRAVDPDGIAESLRERELFPKIDPLIDPSEDFIEE
jgi:hypothetical protein